jgi:hypothetical protein
MILPQNELPEAVLERMRISLLLTRWQTGTKPPLVKRWEATFVACWLVSGNELAGFRNSATIGAMHRGLNSQNLGKGKKDDREST